MCKRFREDIRKFYEGGAVNAKSNAGFGYIAKTINENFGVNVKDLSLTQINAYLLELARGIKAQREAEKKSYPTKTLGPNTSLKDLKNMGFAFKRIVKKKGG